jgi:penicillin-binding protein 2
MASFRKLQRRTGWAIADAPTVRRRAFYCVAFLCLAFFGLLARLWYLQVVRGADYLAQAQENRLRDVPLSAPRGLILDRNNTVLATSRVTHSIAVVPAALPSAKREPKERQRILNSLGFLLKITPAQIEAELAEARRRGGGYYDPVPIVDEADLATITLIEENKFRLGRAVLVTDDIKRFYPQGRLAAHVLGYTRIVDERDLKRNAEELKNDDQARELHFGDVIGKSGIEREYDRRLAGTEGSDRYEVDAHARPVRRVSRIPEKPGNTIVLTIDAKLQRAAEQALAKARNSGAIAAIDPRNGEVLALASRPNFDPNVFSLPRRSFNKIWPSIDKNPKKPLFNRASSSRFPPASTFKAITSLAVLQRGAATTSSVYSCGGGMRLGGRFFGCWTVHGTVNLNGAIAHSCDVYFYQTSLRLGDPEGSGPEYLAAMARQFGLGEKTGIDLPSDSAGLVPTPEWRRRVNRTRPDLARWFPGNTLNMSIGQGDVLATPLQMASVAATLGNGGTVWQPHLLKQVRGSKIEVAVPRARRRINVETRHLNQVRAGLRAVVTGGTGRVVNLPWVTVAGKTGSAEDDSHALPHAWFICYAPAENPRIAIAAIVENSGHGSENAAPLCKAVLEAAFPKPAGMKAGAPTSVRGD